MEFDDFQTYDAALADEGIWVPIKRGGRTLAEFQVRYVDGLTQAGELEYKRARGRFAKMFKVGAMDDFDAAIIALAYVNLRDWKGVKSKGKEVDFTPEAAREFFTRDKNRWMTLELLKMANDTENFVTEEEFDAETIAKN